MTSRRVIETTHLQSTTSRAVGDSQRRTLLVKKRHNAYCHGHCDNTRPTRHRFRSFRLHHPVSPSPPVYNPLTVHIHLASRLPPLKSHSPPSPLFTTNTRLSTIGYRLLFGSPSAPFTLTAPAIKLLPSPRSGYSPQTHAATFTPRPSNTHGLLRSVRSTLKMFGMLSVSLACAC